MASSPDLDQLKAGMRAVWMAGDFGKIASYSEEEAEHFAASLGITEGMRVLDVACGTGNLSLPAARRKAIVTGVDIASNLLRQARHRAAEKNLDITFEEGDAEDLPFREGEFDMVISMFGAMFAPRPDLVAREMARVCRHGGKIAMANWTAGGFAGKMFQLNHKYLPPPPGITPPVLWGDEATVRARFDAVGVTVETKRRLMMFNYPHPPADVVQFFIDYFGPNTMAYARMDPAKQVLYRADLENLWTQYNQSTDGKTLVENEYLALIGTRG